MGLVLEHKRSFRVCARERTAWSSTPFCVEINARKRGHDTGMTQKNVRTIYTESHPSRAFLDLSEVSVISEDVSPSFCDLKTIFFVPKSGYLSFSSKNDFLTVIWISAAKHSLFSNVSLCCCFVSGLSLSQWRSGVEDFSTVYEDQTPKNSFFLLE